MLRACLAAFIPNVLAISLRADQLVSPVNNQLPLETSREWTHGIQVLIDDAKDLTDQLLHPDPDVIGPLRVVRFLRSKGGDIARAKEAYRGLKKNLKNISGT